MADRQSPGQDGRLNKRGDRLTGVACASGAYALWGLFPLYFKAVAAVPALEVLAHRIVWSLLVVFVALVLGGGLGAAGAIFRQPRLLAVLAASAAALTVNWGVFIYAIDSGQVLQSSLGYFINPLVSILLGVAVLGERLNRLQWLAVALAASGVVLEVVTVGSLPWIALALAFSFAAYGLLRKLAPAEALAGLFAETALLAPVALAYLLVLAAKGEGTFAADTIRLDLLLVLAGLVTALPLVLFVAGARRVRLVTVGLLQYIAPTGHFLLALFVFGETITLLHGLTFALTWVGLALYTADALRGPLRVRRAAA
ncbi:MAG: EamA family transporter RarD [Rhodospirillales bacterium]